MYAHPMLQRDPPSQKEQRHAIHNLTQFATRRSYNANQEHHRRHLATSHNVARTWTSTLFLSILCFPLSPQQLVSWLLGLLLPNSHIDAA